MLKKLLILSLSLFTLASCGPNNDKPNTEQNKPNEQEQVKPNDQQVDISKLTKKQSFSYTFDSTDMKTGNTSFTKNGLTFTYSEPTYLGFNPVKGTHIGSKNRPEPNFNIEVNFNENVIINDYNLELSVASGGDASCKVIYGTKEDIHKFTTTDPTNYNKLDLNELTTSLKLNLSATAKAMYFKSISFSVLTSEDSKLNLQASSTEEVLTPVEPGKNNVPNTIYQPISKEAYYNAFDLTKTGDALRLELDTKNDLKTKFSYGDVRYILTYTDESLTTKGKVYGIYDDKEYKASWENGATWNREHVWACNHMTHTGNRDLNNDTIDHKSDLHNLRVSTTTVNSSRGDNYFSDINGNNTFFPNLAKNDHRGDVARILFYMYCNYDFLFLNDTPETNIDFAMGYLSTLIKWNNEDPVDAFEIQRNDRIYQYQGNRNPFIDYPNLANQLFN